MSTSQQPRVTILGAVAPDLENWIAQRFNAHFFRDQDSFQQSDEWQRSNAIIIRSPFSLTSEDIAKCPNLQVVCRAGAGTDNVDCVALNSRSIAFHSFASNANAVAELVIGGLLCLKRGLIGHRDQFLNGRWSKYESMGTEISSMHLVVVGFGRIGHRIATLAKAFGASCVAVESRNRWSEKTAKANAEGITLTDDLDSALPKAGALILTCPLTNGTDNLLNELRINLLRRNSYLVNVSRGRVWDFDAVLDALWENRIAGVICDVFQNEPPEPDPRFAHERLVLTPHIGGQTIESHMATSEQIRNLLDTYF